jgi:lipoprotein-anchoring transpeptidase ErfK/SrfK
MKSKNSTLIFILTSALLLSACIYSASKTSRLAASTKSVVDSTNIIAVNKTQVVKTQISAPAATIAPKTYKIGDNSNEITIIQEKLNKFGYNLTIDKNFGKFTDFAVKDFQLKHKIINDGIVGEVVLKMLDTSPTLSTMYTPDPKTLSASSSQKILPTDNNYYENFINTQDCISQTNDYIYVNLQQEMIYIFTGSNHNWKMVNSFSCASGKSSTPTIRGHFSVGSKGTSFKSSGGAVCKYFTQISGNYLFHSILYDSSGKYVTDPTLGASVSHGCVRLALKNALYIYNNMPHGTQIWIK